MVQSTSDTENHAHDQEAEYGESAVLNQLFDEGLLDPRTFATLELDLYNLRTHVHGRLPSTIVQ